MKKRLLAFVLVFAALVFNAYAEDSSEWSYSPEKSESKDVWTFLLGSDDGFLNEGMSYEPVMLLAGNQEIEAWLVKTARADEEGKSEPAGYLIMYVQLDPEPRIIDAVPAGEKPMEKAPSCEIKFLLDGSKLLDEEHKLAPEYHELFEIGDKCKTISAIYADTENKDYLAAGWANRIRVKDGKSKYTMTYKKRYPVTENQLEDALAEAKADGFSLYNSRFPAEVDWGYSKMTLSFSSEFDIKLDKEVDLDELTAEGAREMILEHMPPEEKKALSTEGGSSADTELQIVGPIHMSRYSGKLDGKTIRIEVWPIPEGEEIRYIVEFSAECDSVEEAETLRDGMMEKLDGWGIMVHEDELKTEMILNGI